MTTQQDLFGGVAEIKNERMPLIDVFLTGPIVRIPLCCVISSYKFQVGMRSNESLSCKNCKLGFMDNKFLDYNHEEHMKNVLKFKPKYATIRDYFNEDQCHMLGIKYFSLEELTSHANIFIENGITPIIIPKFKESFNQIEAIENFDKYVVGYSMAGKFGKAKKIPFPQYIDRGYKIHILGNSPETQIRFYKKYPENIVSMDSAVIASLTMAKTIWKPKKSLSKTCGIKLQSVRFPRPGFAMAGTILGLSMCNLYNFIVHECDGI